jgi:hypothetical protein
MTMTLDGFSKDEIADNLMLFLFAGYAAASYAATSYTTSPLLSPLFCTLCLLPLHSLWALRSLGTIRAQLP